ncbi:RND superfamily putative drug exporter [Kitasatospora sp. MAA4]|uniref:MMPL family transporter n=1 Tax=Kitasatospora sp. MAA4 TaxID=3035093 RepID=UPI002473B3DB|nr:MMPL family transporter [Kitasatospora sp. MAA4]MDH6132236.1 RND superfamily putative drug exporter [Kitasatospora sp. MAA4]
MSSVPTPPVTAQARPGPGTPTSARRLPVALRRPRWVLWFSLVFLVLTGVLAGGASAAMKNGGFDDPSSDSAQAAQLLAAKFPAGQANLVLLVQDETDGVDAPQVARTGTSLLATLAAEPGVHVVDSYFTTGDPGLRSRDGHSALTTANVSGDEDAVARTTTRLHGLLARTTGPITVRFGGVAQVTNDLTDQTNSDLALSESIALPLTLVLLFFVFRGVVAALLPLCVGLLSISGSLALLYGLGQVTSVSVFAVNLTTALGLGLSVDYSLLIVSRYREERAGGLAGPQALAVTLRTAGRTVIFSGAIVAAVLSTLLVFKQYFLSSFAYAGVAVVGITVLCALLPLPAALLLVGDRIDSWALGGRPRSGDPQEPKAAEDRLWGRIAGATMRRPWLAGALVVALLAVMAWPLTGAQFGVPDERALPKGEESRVVADIARAQFPGDDAGALSLISENWPGATTGGELSDYAARLSALPHVTSVTSAAGRFQHGRLVGTPGPLPGFTVDAATLLQVDNDVVPYSPGGEQVVRSVRAVAVPGGHRVYVGGLAAQYLDVTASIGDRLPLGIGLAALLTLVLLSLATGSILLPVKAVLFNALGLGAVLGAMVWVFQYGHLAGLIGVTPAPIAVTMPVLLLCIAYALSMDYEMFVLSRIKERYTETGDPYRSVREGLGGSGPIITAAAAILAVSFFSTAISGVSLAKLFGIGTGLAVVLDAVLVRGVLVPVFLQVFGTAAWWAPAPLKRFTRRISGAVGEH